MRSYAISLRADYLYKLFGIPPYGKFASSPSFINLFNHYLYLCGLLGVYVHIGYNPLLPFFIVHIVPALTTGSFQLDPVLLRHTPIIVCYCMNVCVLGFFVCF